jgi:hypothetical protein
MTKIPKRKMLIGHGLGEDIYETPKGTLYGYKGTKTSHWKNLKYWRKMKKVV